MGVKVFVNLCVSVLMLSAAPAGAQSSASFDRGCASDANWPMTLKKLDQLAQVAQCGKNFSQSECRSNLGLAAGGATATLAAAVGTNAAMRARRMPKLCGLRGFSDYDLAPSKTFVATLLESLVAPAHAATCADPSQEMARTVRQNFEAAKADIEESVRQTGRERMAKENPALAKNVDEQIRLKREMLGAKAPVRTSSNRYTFDRDLDFHQEWRAQQMKKIRALEDEARQMIGSLKITTENGRVVRTTVTSMQNPEVARLQSVFDDLMDSRAGALDTPEGKTRTVNSLMKRYSYDYGKSAATLKELGIMQTELATKTVSPERLATMLDSLAEKAPAHQLSRLAALRLELTERFKIPGASTASRMAREGFKAIGKVGGKAGGGILALATGTAAFAADPDSARSLGDRVLTDFVGASSVGCASVDSDWATVEGDGDCSYRARWNAKTTDFALQPEDVQRRELARYPQLCAVIDKVHADLNSSSVRVTCQDHGAVISDDRRRFTMVVNYDADGLVDTATVTGPGVRFAEYEMKFDGDQFVSARFPETSAFGNAGKTADFKNPGFKTATVTRTGLGGASSEQRHQLENAEDHFSMVQPQVQFAQACCSGALGANDPRCEAMNRGGGKPSGAPSGRPTTR